MALFDALLTGVGILLGTLTGLLPGLHSNTVAAMLQEMALDPVALTIVVIGTAITHTVISAIPAVLVGVPEASLALLPQHRYALRARAYEVLRLTGVGSVIGALAALLALPLLIGLSYVEKVVAMVAPFVIVVMLVVTIVSSGRIVQSVFFALVASVVGYVVLEYVPSNPLLALFAGLYGLPSLLLATSDVPRTQLVPKVFLAPPGVWKLVAMATVAAIVCTITPALGSAQAALMVMAFVKGDEAFIFVCGMLNTMVQVLALGWWKLSGSTRTGTAVALESLGIEVSWSALVVVVLAGICIAGVIMFVLSRFVVRRHHWLSRPVVRIGAGVFVLLLTILSAGLLGVLALVACTAVGIAALRLCVRRSVLMAALVVPYVMGIVL